LSQTSAASLIKVGAITGLAAGIVNMVVFFVGKAVGVAFTAKIGGTTSAIVFAQPLIASFIAILLGTLLLVPLSGSARGVTIWLVVAAVVFVGYSAFAFSAAGTTGTGVALVLMHAIALAAAIARVVPVARARAAGTIGA
jgi:hypothetical protein